MIQRIKLFGKWKVALHWPCVKHRQESMTCSQVRTNTDWAVVESRKWPWAKQFQFLWNLVGRGKLSSAEQFSGFPRYAYHWIKSLRSRGFKHGPTPTMSMATQFQKHLQPGDSPPGDGIDSLHTWITLTHYILHVSCSLLTENHRLTTLHTCINIPTKHVHAFIHALHYARCLDSRLDLSTLHFPTCFLSGLCWRSSLAKKLRVTLHTYMIQKYCPKTWIKKHALASGIESSDE